MGVPSFSRIGPKDFVLCAMTLSMPDPSISWDRTLPRLSAFLQNISHDPFATSRGSSLLQHHIVSDRLSRDFIDSASRRSTVPCIAYQQGPPDPQGVEPVLDPRNTVTGNGADAEHLTKKRPASHMAEETRSSEASPSSPSAAEGANQFCLCQPDPKIPRPRNGATLFC